MYKVNKHKSKKGITLIETVVSITIVIIMVAAISTAFLEREGEISLSLFRNQLIGDLRFMQVKSINSVNNFGIFIELNNRYILFEDRNRNNSFDPGEKIRHINLPGGIIFLPPSVGQNIVFQKDGSLPPNVTDIILTVTNRIIEKNISINRKGLIN